MNRTRSSPEGALRDAVALAQLPRVGSVAYRAAVERHGSAAQAFATTTDVALREEALSAADREIARAGEAGADIVVFGEPEYPAPLLDLPDAPGVVYALGARHLLQRRMIGIVGTRNASPSGERVARRMAFLLAQAGATVVSGMAFGIDAAAHQGALEAHGGTIAVLGGGVDVPYPPSHRTLHERIRRDGLVLSEAPMGTRPVPGAFPRRNRIIAALSELLVVVEAGERSGALITSRLALELGRSVAAVPGPIDSPRHVGSNGLLASGAAFISSAEQVLELAGIPARRREAVAAGDLKGDDGADPSAQSVVDAIERGVTDVDDLVRTTRLSARELGAVLSALEVQGRLTLNDAGAVSLTP